MEPTNRHPLECITGQSGLAMLECLIPFVDARLKLPLALFIKFNEIRLILNAFQSDETLSRFGLNAPSNTMTDMLCAMTGIPPDMINAALNMTQGSGFPFGDGASFGGGFPFGDGASYGNGFPFGNDTPYGSGFPFGTNMSYGAGASFCGEAGNVQDLDDAISNIFAEYDMEQAENTMGQDSSENDTHSFYNTGSNI